MIKRILVPLDPSPFAEAAVEFACHLAKWHSAEVVGLVILDVPGIERSVGPVPIGGLYYAERVVAEQEKRTEARIRVLLDRFRAKCQERGVAHAESERQGSPSISITAESFYYDCVVMGLRNYFQFRDDAGADERYGTADDRSGDSLEQVMQRAVVPVFAVPMNWCPPDGKLRALLAFDESPPSVRALHALTRTLDPAHAEITVMTSCEEAAQGRLRLDPAAAFLCAHGFAPVRQEWTSLEPRQLADCVQFRSADLIALGAHSQRALIDFMIGSVCKDLINRGDKPLLIAH